MHTSFVLFAKSTILSRVRTPSYIFLSRNKNGWDKRSQFMQHWFQSSLYIYISLKKKTSLPSFSEHKYNNVICVSLNSLNTNSKHSKTIEIWKEEEKTQPLCSIIFQLKIRHISIT